MSKSAFTLYVCMQCKCAWTSNDCIQSTKRKSHFSFVLKQFPSHFRACSHVQLTVSSVASFVCLQYNSYRIPTSFMHPRSLSTTKEFHFPPSLPIKLRCRLSKHNNRYRAHIHWAEEYSDRPRKTSKISKLSFFPKNKFNSIGVVIVAFIHVEQCSCGFVITQLHSMWIATDKQKDTTHASQSHNYLNGWGGFINILLLSSISHY